MFKSFIQRLRRTEFIKNSATLITGTVISQLIPIIFAPFLTRIYTPNDYGTLALYMGISSVFGITSTLQFSNAIILPEKEEEAVSLLNISIRNSILISIIVIALIWPFSSWISNGLKNQNLLFWLTFVPISVFLTGINNSFSAFANRRKLYRTLSINKTLSAIVIVCFSLSIGIGKREVNGLIIGYIAGQIATSLYLVIFILRKTRVRIILFGIPNSQKLIHRYKKITFYLLPSEFINTAVNQLPILMLSNFAGSAAVGFYNLSYRMLTLPISFVSTSIGDVFRERAARDYRTIGNCQSIFVKTLKTLSMLAIVPFFAIVLFGPKIFGFFFGNQWIPAGEFAQVLSFMVMFKFVVSPLSSIYLIAGNYKGDLINNLYFLVSTFLILYFFLPNNISTALLLFSINYSLLYIHVINKSYKLARNGKLY